MANRVASQSEHPSPHRERVSIPWLFAGLAAGPTAWITQLVFSYGLSSDLCMAARRTGAGLNAQAATSERGVLIAVNLISFILALTGAGLSWRHWRATRGEKSGDADTVLSTGEGRTRFISVFGILSGLGFSMAILFNTIEPFIVAACWAARR